MLDPEQPAPPVAAAVATLGQRATRAGRFLLGLVGPPGVGKSTVAGALAGAWPAGDAVVVGMDGFHLADDELAGRGLDQVKGAPETFDADGFVALLRRLCDPGVGPVGAPGFDRSRERTVDDAVSIPRETGLVLVEGNYLLLDGPWRPVRDLLDEVWYLDLADELRRQRLVARHVAGGRTPDEAAAWVHRSDEANAALIAATRHLADAVLDVTTGQVSPA